MRLGDGTVRLFVIVLFLFVFSVFPTVAQDGTPNPKSDREAEGARFLRGAIDMHFHMDAPTVNTPGTDISKVRVARALGLRGLLLKSHDESTATLAYQLRLEMPDFEIFGGVALNRANGGINAVAVEHLAQIRGTLGRVVWMPTQDSEIGAKTTPGKPFVAVSRNGGLLPEVVAVISLIARKGLVLASGHIAPEEALMVFREGRRQGVQHMIATHPMEGAGKMTLEQMQEAAKLGAILEFDFRHIMDEGGRRADAMRKVGPEHCFISEFWTKQQLTPPYLPIEYGNLDGVGAFVEAMHAHGFTEHELDVMVKDNPAQLLGLTKQ